MATSQSANTYVQPAAEIDWRTPATPRSTEHGDIYWSLDQGLAEKQHVFAGGNRLRERWQGLLGHHFTIAEVGFGFGLNCLLTANLWRQCNPQDCILHIFAYEYRPVTNEDLARLLALLAPVDGVDWPTFQRHRAALMDAWPLPSPGQHLIWLDDDICLNLVIGDANVQLAESRARVDAWYLDGFSPSRNESAWRTSIYHNMARMSRPGATVATYSVAGDVRRGLTDAGFEIARQTGFGNKAEMLTACAPGDWQPASLARPGVAIIGAGIAGMQCATALARRGIRARVFDGRPTALAGASSVPYLAISPRVSVEPDSQSLFSLAAFHYAMQQATGIERRGYCRLLDTERAVSRNRRINAHFPDRFCRWLEADQASDVAGCRVPYPALWFPDGGWCRPEEQFDGIRDRIDLHISARVAQIVTGNDVVELVLDNGERHTCEHLVIATGAAPLEITAPLGLMPVRGQAMTVRIRGCNLETALAGAMSIIPSGDGTFTVGATFVPKDDDDSVRASETTQLTEKLSGIVNGEIEVLEQYTGIRCGTRDRSPVIGHLPLRQDRGVGNVYIAGGFGSHGATFTPLAGEQLARLITGEAEALPASWRERLSPSRYLTSG